MISRENGAKLIQLAQLCTEGFRSCPGIGGNVSLKTDPGLLIKASGEELSGCFDTSIFTTVTNTSEEMDSCLESQSEPKLNYSGARPSIETYMHYAIPRKYVIHFHPTMMMPWICEENFPSRLKLDFTMTSQVFYIDYVKPGFQLALEIFKHKSEFEEANENIIVFLRNHGLIIAGNSIDSIRHTFHKLNQVFINKVSAFQAEAQEHLRIVKNDCADLEGFTEISRLISVPKIDDFVERVQEYWAYCPDHLVLFGSDVQHSNSGSDGASRCRLYDGNLYLTNASLNSNKLQQMEAFIWFLKLVEITGINCKMLNVPEIMELIEWDAEKYRIKKMIK